VNGLAASELVGDLLRFAGGSAESLSDRLAGVSMLAVSIALLLHLGKLLARARAWHAIVGAAYPGEHVRYRHALGAYVGGIGANAVLPGRPGEALKLVLLKRKSPGVGYRALVSTLVVESSFDLFAGIAAVGFGIVSGWTTFGSSLDLLFGASGRHVWVTVIASATLVALLGAASFALRGRALAIAAELAKGFAVVRRPRTYVTGVLAWQFAALGLRLASIYAFLLAFHIPATLTATLLVVAAQSAANLIPVTPNGAGPQQALLVLVLAPIAAASSVFRFGAGAQLATAVWEVTLALVSLALMTGSLRWRGLLAARTELSSSA